MTNADNALVAFPSSVSRFLKASSLPIRASAVSSLPAIASGRPRGATRLIIARTRKPVVTELGSGGQGEMAFLVCNNLASAQHRIERAGAMAAGLTMPIAAILTLMY